MYDTTSAASAVGGPVLAATGLSVGSGVLTVVGLVLAGIALFLLVRKNGKVKP